MNDETRKDELAQLLREYPTWGDAALAYKNEVERLRKDLRELIGACAPPVEALLLVHPDGKWIAPETVEGLRKAAAVLRKHVAALEETEAE